MDKPSSIDDCLECQGIQHRFNKAGMYIECDKYHATSDTDRKCVWQTVIESDLEKLERGDYNVTFPELENYRV